ncbi:hypothetical protein SAMN05192558_10751 [Actinokineospora alba]|uniref:Uncharacterized protein n=1 Tax=Actinokineospora alba TaxID=504798 RepID=A0A1H0QNX3_9PSEU|nr:DUF5361 domain-containing protein [Actinokineospora alba]SDI30297.1 hypothetical protein SAMN05421871_10450 [Actinokineospora alba]SDP18368.1 hypothetical protein SAMN05192558_10751 [Actinokineospora alba]
MLIEHLPGDSAFAKSMHGEEAAWNLSDHLLAAMVDHLAVSNWMFASVNRDEDAEEIPYPQAIPRPGDAPQAKDEQDGSAGPADLAAFFSS